MKKKLVSIIIPTLNSETFLPICLEAIKEQTYKDIEIIIVDGGSTDATVTIAKKYHVAKVTLYKKALLGARSEGINFVNGEYVVLLDSDQVLEKTAVERAVNEMKIYDMLVLDEDVYQVKTFVEKLFHEDRKVINTVKDTSPFTGVMLPRFYKFTLIEKAFKKIPKNIIEKVGGQDHAIIYYEAWKISKKVGILPNAVFHIEPNSIRIIWKKFYKWGYTSVDAHFEGYEELLAKKERFRTGLFKKGLIKASFASIFLLLLKGVPYKTGYFIRKVKK